MTRYKIIINPAANKGSCLHSLPQIEKLMKQHNLDYEIVQTVNPGHATELALHAAEKEGFDVVVAAGGDGTINEVFHALALARKNATSNAALGIIPVGSGNDFAFALKIPLKIEEACAVLARGQTRKIDAGFVIGGPYPDGHFFDNGVGIGFDAMINWLSTQQKYLRGFLSYLVAAIKAIIFYYKAPIVSIQLDDETIKQASLMISVMNGRRLGGGFIMAPESQLDDGLLDICIADRIGRGKLLPILTKFFSGTQGSSPAIHFKRSRKIVITTQDNQTLPAHMDGEPIGTDIQQLSIELFPGLLDIIA